MPWLGRARKYTMWMSPPFTRGSTRTASTPSAIRRSLLSLSTNPWGRTLASPLSTFFHPLACFTLSCPFVAVTNSPFLCVVPVSRKSRPNKQTNRCRLQRTHYCHHWDVDWMLHSTWCTSELVKAVEKDYILHKIHEVWHFPEAQRWTGLFADYVNTRLKIKKESAGWPSWCQTMDQKREYILRYQEREGIRLDVSQMVKNSGRKAKAKLMLNRYPFYVLFSCCHSTPSHHFFPSWSFLGQIWRTG